MISEKRLVELIEKYSHFTTQHRLKCCVITINPEDVPKGMSEAEIIEKISTIHEDYTPAEDMCEDSILKFDNPFTGKKHEFYAQQGCPFFSTNEETMRRTNLLGS